MMTDRELDILSIGEILVDFISEEVCQDLSLVPSFRRILGGSPVNIAVNGARLGGRTAVMARTGADFFGDFLESELKGYGVETTYLTRDPDANTSIIFVSRTEGTPSYEPFRGSDYELSPRLIDPAAVQRARLVHSSAFALSREPLRSAVIKVFKLARDNGKIISFDPNYREKIWPDKGEAIEVIREVYRYADITKPSLDDAVNIFGQGYTPGEYAGMFAGMGPSIVILTMGEKGALYYSSGKPPVVIPSRKVRVKDVTGAGDAFWAAFIMAHLDGLDVEKCVLFAREMVELKLSRVGPLPDSIDRRAVYPKLESPVEERNTTPEHARDNEEKKFE